MSTNFIPCVIDAVSLRGRRTKGREGGKLNASAKRDRWALVGTDLLSDIFISVLESLVSLSQIKPWLSVSSLMTKRIKLYKCLLNCFCFCFVISLKGTQIIPFLNYA